jgi:broad specificity phosphatase PhoE
MKRHAKKRKKMNPKPTSVSAAVAHTNIISQLTGHAKQIEQHWATIFHGLCKASEDHPHLDIEHFNALHDKFTVALDRLHSDLQSPTLIIVTTGTTSSGKNAIINLLLGVDLIPRMAQEMCAGAV